MRATDFAALFDLWRAGDEVAAAAYFEPDGVYQEAKKAPVVGRAAIEAHWGRFFHGGPEWRMEVIDCFGSDDRFAITYTFEIKSSDGTWTLHPGCAIVRVRDGLIELWREYSG